MGKTNDEKQVRPVITDNNIILFANQKGGVGKTTLCAMFANYLAEQNVRLLVLDADIQQTLKKQREDDLKQLKVQYQDKDPNSLIPYKVQSVTISNQQNTRTIMEYLKKTAGTIIIDTPGNLSQDGFVELIAKTDYIICPYHYDMNTLGSTRAFALAVLKLKMSYPNIKAKILFVCNNHEKKVGKAEELQAFKKIDDYFKKFGTLMPRINHRAEIMMRYNTISNGKEVEKDLNPCFSSLFETIYNKDKDNGNIQK
jgi:chromosome partitioning protein